MSTIHKIAFSLIKGATPSMATHILEKLGTEEEFFMLSENSLAARFGTRANFFSDATRSQLLQQAKDEERFITDNKIRAIYHTDPEYPYRLRECEDAPLMLYTLGETNLNASHVVSVVGTRNATMYGVNFINSLIDELHAMFDDILIISGLALGCDITAHKRALENGIPTAGVVAHGLDTLYPSEHRRYAAKMIAGGGGLITDYPHGTRPHRGNFLARNRIVAGMADCVVVAESAAKRGGALHTAKLASLYNRDVFALPGRTSDVYSGGCNKLIRENIAHLIENAEDLAKAMNWTPKPKAGVQKEMFVELTAEQENIVSYIRDNGEAQINALAAHTGIPIGQLMATLVELEFNGVTLSLPGARYTLA